MTPSLLTSISAISADNSSSEHRCPMLKRVSLNSVLLMMPLQSASNTLNIASYCSWGVMMGLWCLDISLMNSDILRAPSLLESTEPIIWAISSSEGFRPIVSRRTLSSTTEIEPSPFRSYLLNAPSYSAIWSVVKVTGCSILRSDRSKRHDLPDSEPLRKRVCSLRLLCRHTTPRWLNMKFLVESRNFCIRRVLACASLVGSLATSSGRLRRRIGFTAFLSELESASREVLDLLNFRNMLSIAEEDSWGILVVGKTRALWLSLSQRAILLGWSSEILNSQLYINIHQSLLLLPASKVSCQTLANNSY